MLIFWLLLKQIIVVYLCNHCRIPFRCNSYFCCSCFKTDKKTDNNDLANQYTWLDHIASLPERHLRAHIELITLSCLLLASKLNEQNQSQPSIRHLQRQVNEKFSYDEFVDQERWLIVDCLGWGGINVTTPYHVSDSI